MKILRLDLLAFGPFSGQSLEFSESGLHLIYGPNEAGKSSTLRGLRQFLYGFPHQTQDSFLHPYNKLRIGAKLLDERGNVLECIRRKGLKNTLRGPDDMETVEPQRLEQLLGGVDQEAFSQRFGIDYEELVAGGRSIVQGGSELGGILFAAGAGVANLNQVQAKLARDAEALFKKTQGASVPKINKNLTALQQVRKRIQEAQLPDAKWIQHEQTWKAALSDKEKLDREFHQSETRRSFLARVRQALSTIAKRQWLQKELAELQDAPQLPEGFSEQRMKAEQDRERAISNDEQAALTLSEIDVDLGRLEISEPLLQKAEEVQVLKEKLGAHRKAFSDRELLIAQRQTALEEARRLLTELGRDGDLQEQANSLQLTRPQRARLQELGEQRQALRERMQSSQQQLETLEKQLAKAERQWRAEEPPPDPAPLLQVIRRVQRQGDLQQRQRQWQNELQELRQQAEKKLRRLTLWSGVLEEAVQLQPPPAETLERWEDEFDQLEGERREQRRAAEQLEQDRSEWERQFELLRLKQDPLTEADLAEARQLRDEGWRLVREGWMTELARRNQASQNFVRRFPEADDLLQAFWSAIEQADQAADRLRRESEQSAEKARLIADQHKLERRSEQLQKQRQEEETRRQVWEDGWRTLWAPLHIEPLSPREMRGWTARWKELWQAAERLEVLQQESEQAAEAIENHRRELRRRLEELAGETSAELDDLELEDLLKQAERFAEQLRQTQRRRLQQEQEREDLKQQAPELKRQAEQAAADWENWRARWAAAMQVLELSPEASPAEAHEVASGGDELAAKLKKAEHFQQRIQGIEADGAKFDQQVRQLCEELAEDLLEPPTEQAAAELHRRLGVSQKEQARQAELQELQKRELQRHKKAIAQRKEAESLLRALCREAGCEAPQELPQIESRANRRREVENRLREVEEMLLELAAGATLEEFIAQASAEDADQIAAEIEQLEERTRKMQKQREELDRTIGREEAERRRMDGNAQAAETEEEAQDLLTQIRNDAEQYARLRLAEAVLRQAIERYREKNQGPVLQRASRIFSQLTRGSFSGLRDDYDEKGKAALVGVRGDGKTTVGVEGMSDGSCDQLYLALRLASLEHYLEHNEPLPLIVDDIFIQFDDGRSAAALQALAELSQKTQVIFFTHHEHLIELAQQNLPLERLQVLRLESRLSPHCAK